MDELLKVADLHVYYGMIHAIRGISFEMKRDEIVTLIGANDAGKTTTFHTITGLLSSPGGEAVYNGQNITHMPGYQLVRRGLAHIPEGRRVFSQLPVLQSLELGAFTRRSKGEKTESLKEIYRRLPRPAERKNQLADTLSGGKQQMLAIGRVLASKPRMLVLDEPSMGLSSTYMNETFDIIKSTHESGTTVLLVKRSVKKVLSIVNRTYVLETSTIRLSDTAEELLRNARVKSTYLSE